MTGRASKPLSELRRLVEAADFREINALKGSVSELPIATSSYFPTEPIRTATKAAIADIDLLILLLEMSHLGDGVDLALGIAREKALLAVDFLAAEIERGSAIEAALTAPGP